MGIDAIALVDGTGRWWDSDYERDMQHSFCSQIARTFAGKTQWKRGPSDEGMRFREKAEVAAAFLLDESRCGATRLFLAGYSRGAAIALIAAEILDKQSIPVNGLFLFDPVVRTPNLRSMDTRVIPANVKLSRMAYRNLSEKIVKRYDGMLLQKPYNLLPLVTKSQAKVISRIPGMKEIPGTGIPWTGNPIRPEFGVFQLSQCTIGDHRTAEFTGSHGALGGVGWRDVVEDVDCQNAVASWFSEAFQRLSLKCKLVSHRPVSTFDP